MLLVISPAKTLNDEAPSTPAALWTYPELLAHSVQLIDILKKHSPAQLATLMNISEPLARLNASRFSQWSQPFTLLNATPAALSFSGDVYRGLNAPSLTLIQMTWLQNNLRILSGLYGILRPFDLIQAYRLEMGTLLVTERGKSLYNFWHNIITDCINTHLANDPSPILVNLASKEYFTSVNTSLLNAQIITPIFQDYKNGQYKNISFYAKRARGLMARWAAQNNISDPNALKHFDSEGYRFDASASERFTWVFRRQLIQTPRL